jgi:golgi phosphoprotein 3
MLTLQEEMFLLCIDDAKGAVTSSAIDALPFGLAGAILADLTLQGKICVDVWRVVAINPSEGALSANGDVLLEAVFVDLMAVDDPRKVSYWVERLARKKVEKRVLEGLVAKGVLREEEKRYLWVIPYTVYTQQNASAKYDIKQHLRAIVMADQKAEPRSIILLSLLKSCRLLKLVFTKDEREAAEKRIGALVKDEQFGEAVAQTIKSIEAAAIAAMMSNAGI